MIDRAEVAGCYPKFTYREIALKYGVTRAVISGIMYRSRRAPIPRTDHSSAPLNRGGRPDAKYDTAILMLLGDGRMRTTSEIARAVRCSMAHCWTRLSGLRNSGVVRLVETGKGGLPSIWQADEGDE